MLMKMLHSVPRHPANWVPKLYKNGKKSIRRKIDFLLERTALGDFSDSNPNFEVSRTRYVFYTLTFLLSLILKSSVHFLNIAISRFFFFL